MDDITWAKVVKTIYLVVINIKVIRIVFVVTFFTSILTILFLCPNLYADYLSSSRMVFITNLLLF